MLRCSFLTASDGSTRRAQMKYRSSANRAGGFHFSYRPLVRNWRTFRSKALGTVDVAPLANSLRPAWNSGMYLPRIPGFPRLAFRAKDGYTDLDKSPSHNGNFRWSFYYHGRSTNKRSLTGSWTGRDRKGHRKWTIYRCSARNSLQLGFHHANVSNDFIPAGEALTDGYANLNRLLPRGVDVFGGMQHDEWLAPILAPGPQTDWTASFQLAFYPPWGQ